MSHIKTELLFNKEAKDSLLRGVNIMADAVSSTLGPRGQNVALAKYVPNNGEIYQRVVIHDGVTVANFIDLEDEFENMGAQLLKQAAQKQVDIVGDGTTAVMILARAIIQESMELIASGVNPMALRKGLEQSSERLVNQLEQMAKPVSGVKDMEYIATISAEDEELGKLVAKTLDKVGKDGVVTVEESKSQFTTVDHQEGMQFDRGFIHPWFINNPNREEARLENAYFLITDLSLTTLAPLAAFFESLLKKSNILVIISPDISGEALPLLIKNKMEGKLFSIAIQAPSFGQNQKDILQDLAILTGGTYISGDAGYKLDDITIEHLGFAEYVASTKDATVIVGGSGTKKSIAERVESMKTSLLTTDGDFDKEQLKARIGKLTSGVAVIHVGGHTEVEMKERRERVIDAVAATRAAMEKGIVAGGEIAYLHARKYLGDPRGLHDIILYNALYQPFYKLIHNAGLSEVDCALALQKKRESWGIDVTDGKAKDMIKNRIVDPVLVPMHAIRNAVSVAIQIMTTNVIGVPKIIEKI